LSRRTTAFATFATTWLVIAAIISGCGGGGNLGAGGASKEVLGRILFFDPRLSEPAGTACVTCHQPFRAFTDPRQDVPTSEGAVAGLFWKRQTPTLSYMAYSPPLYFEDGFQDYFGGQFWDGRAPDFATQVRFPLFNHAEMNNASVDQVVQKVANSPEAIMMKQIYGDNIFSDTTRAFDAIADAITAYENSAEFRPFTSKFDYWRAGKVNFSPSEKHGFELFMTKAGCAETCHPALHNPNAPPPLFTNFGYENLGIPKNPQNPFYHMPLSINPDGEAFIDQGLAPTTGRESDIGRFKTPTLRNVAITAPYMHNGVFKTLEEVVRFYSERDLGHFPPPEYPDTINTTELGDLKLTDQEVSDIVAFLKTLTDGYDFSRH